MYLTLLRPPAGFGQPASPRSQFRQQSMVRRYEVGFAVAGYRIAQRGENESSGRRRVLDGSFGFRWCRTEEKLTVFIITQNFLELGQVTVLVSDRNGAHALDFSQLSVLGCELNGQQGRNIFGLDYLMVHKS